MHRDACPDLGHFGAGRGCSSLICHPGDRRRCEFMTTTPAKATKAVAPLSVPQPAADLDAGLRRLKPDLGTFLVRA